MISLPAWTNIIMGSIVLYTTTVWHYYFETTMSSFLLELEEERPNKVARRRGKKAEGYG